jgi:hypothetical protein
MPIDIDPDAINIDALPGIWSPVQWEMSEAERVYELESQAAASLLDAVDVPEAILRLFLNETAIKRAFAPPEGYDPDLQGEWDVSLVTFQFKRPIQLKTVEREPDYLYVEYDVTDVGVWALEIEPDQVQIYRP